MFGFNKTPKTTMETNDLPPVYTGNLADVSPEIALRRSETVKAEAGRAATLRTLSDSGEVPVVTGRIEVTVDESGDGPVEVN